MNSRTKIAFVIFFLSHKYFFIFPPPFDSLKMLVLFFNVSKYLSFKINLIINTLIKSYFFYLHLDLRFIFWRRKVQKSNNILINQHIIFKRFSFFEKENLFPTEGITNLKALTFSLCLLFLLWYSGLASTKHYQIQVFFFFP